ncbi:MAG: J domain-containing protein [Candidatus Obscuribacterales bacterium]
MRNFNSLTAAKLLSIDAPELLFSRSPDEAKREYRSLARLWHPDCAHDGSAAPEIFAHINELYRLAVIKLSDGSWVEPVEKVEQETPGIKKFRRTNGTIMRVTYQKVQSFELGTMYVSPDTVTFDIEDEHRDLFLNGCQQIGALSFASAAMALEMANSLPQVVDRFKTDGSSIVVLRKTPDQLLLSDVLAHYRGRMKVAHVGWILNCLYNLACYLQWSRLSHNGIAPDTIFISPLRHSAMLLGGWWYARPIGSPLTMVTERTLQFMPTDAMRNKRADHRTDLELIKSIGRELLGDMIGDDLKFNNKLPQNVVDWLLMPSTGNALLDYSSWKDEILRKTFGKPRFVAMKLDTTNFYKEN